ncbi:hypothetical protein G3I43_00005, partial [Streptomyces anulatus]|nr:hypothetical protein [Streptomyces anulatus]
QAAWVRGGRPDALPALVAEAFDALSADLLDEPRPAPERHGPAPDQYRDAPEKDRDAPEQHRDTTSTTSTTSTTGKAEGTEATS